MDAKVVDGRVRDLLADVAGIDPAAIAPDARWAELGVDSVAAVALVARLEESFDLTISEADALHLTTVGAVVRYVARHAR
jgi:acyl carrier protein